VDRAALLYRAETTDWLGLHLLLCYIYIWMPRKVDPENNILSKSYTGTECRVHGVVAWLAVLSSRFTYDTMAVHSVKYGLFFSLFIINVRLYAGKR